MGAPATSQGWQQDLTVLGRGRRHAGGAAGQQGQNRMDLRVGERWPQLSQPRGEPLGHNGSGAILAPGAHNVADIFATNYAFL